MKQVFQHLKTGTVEVADVPAPLEQRGHVLVATRNSLVSVGTERRVADFAEKNLVQKARARPDLARRTLEKAQRDGILSTLEAVQKRLDQPDFLGYSSAGTVIGLGADVSDYQVGDPVACAGGGCAVHAEVVSVPRNLVVKLPEPVDFESAAFTTLGAIALQGIRLAEIELGEIVAVIGLGLLGQLTVQMLKANGCVVIGTDIQPQRVELARQLGADAVATSADGFRTLVLAHSSGYGADAVLIAADTKSNQPVELAGEIARDKGTVVAIGAVGLNIPRRVYFKKELDFRISRSYGPGRYDPEYEEKGHDYPYGFVRWTEQRNMQAFVQLLSQEKVDVQPLITHRFPIDLAPKAYELIMGKTGESFLGVLMTYPDSPDLSHRVTLRTGRIGIVEKADRSGPLIGVDRVRLGVIGAGNYANATLLPALRETERLDFVGIASERGASARSAADRFGFAYCATDVQEILEDPTINTVAILTRHHLHASQVISGLKAGKHVFVEKPLCLTEEEMFEIISTYQALREGASHGGEPSLSPPSPTLTVGFNRRFAPFVTELKQALQGVQEPLMLHYRANAGYIPPDHWTQDPAQGGGRLLGEACHFIDLAIHLVGDTPQRITTRALPDAGRYSQDNLQITLEFANGSLGTVTYVANGDRGSGKEYLEVFGGGLSARLDDYRTLNIYHRKRRVARKARLRQNKGHRVEWETLVAYLTGRGQEPMAFADIILSTRATLAAQQSLVAGEPVTFEREGEPC